MLGFTRRETAVLLFLVVGFGVGMGVRTYQQRWAPLPDVFDENPGDYTFSPEEPEGERVVEADEELISLNRGTQSDLERLPGVGSVVAKRIVAYREKYGGFRSVEELVEVRGIGWKTLEKLRPHIRLD